MESKIDSKRIVAIVTLYFPDNRVYSNIERIASQCDIVILFDNSPVSNSEQFGNIDNVEYYSEQKNYGLSCAFNKVLKKEELAWEQDDYVIFFDQDSEIESNHVEKMVFCFDKLKSQNNRVGCLGPVYFNTSNNKIEIPKLGKYIDNKTIQVKSIITTSMVTQFCVIKDVGFWNENIFLDLADWDLCWRMQQKNYGCYLTLDSQITHSVGEGKKKIGFIELRVGKPFREYYQTRDCMYLLSQSYTPIKYKIRFILMITVRPLLHLFFLDQKKIRMHYIKKGIDDYRNKITGALDMADF